MHHTYAYFSMNPLRTLLIFLVLVVYSAKCDFSVLDNIVVTTVLSPTPIAAANWTKPTGYKTFANQPAPIFTDFVASGSIGVAWSDGVNTSYVTFVDTNNTEGPLVELSVPQIMGFVAHDDYSFAVLAWDAPRMSLIKYNSSGVQLWSAELESDRCIDFDTGSSNLVYGYDAVSKTNRYAAYYKVTGSESGCSPQEAGEQADTVVYVDDDGNVSVGICFGHKHSMSSIIAFNKNSGAFLPVSITDCINSTHGGIILNTDTIALPILGDCNFGYGAELGSVVPYKDGFIVSFTALNGSLSDPSMSFYESWVMEVQKQNNQWIATQPKKIFTAQSYSKIVTKLAPFNTAHENNTFLAGLIYEDCITGQCNRFYALAVFGGEEFVQLTPLETVLEQTANWGERTIFSTGPNGDVAWAYPITTIDGNYEVSQVLAVIRVKADGPTPMPCAGVKPRHDFTCENGKWVHHGGVTVRSYETIVSTTDVWIEGELKFEDGGSWRLTPGAVIHISNCAMLRGRLYLNVYSREEYDALVNNPKVPVITSGLKCFGGDFNLITTSLLFDGVCNNTAYPPPPDCTCLPYIQESPKVADGVYSLELTFDDAHCKPPTFPMWLVIVLVVCGVVMLLVIAAMIICLHPAVKARVFPVERVE